MECLSECIRTNNLIEKLKLFQSNNITQKLLFLNSNINDALIKLEGILTKLYNNSISEEELESTFKPIERFASTIEEFIFAVTNPCDDINKYNSFISFYIDSIDEALDSELENMTPEEMSKEMKENQDFYLTFIENNNKIKLIMEILKFLFCENTQKELLKMLEPYISRIVIQQTGALTVEYNNVLGGIDDEDKKREFLINILRKCINKFLQDPDNYSSGIEVSNDLIRELNQCVINDDIVIEISKMIVYCRRMFAILIINNTVNNLTFTDYDTSSLEEACDSLDILLGKKLPEENKKKQKE